MANASESTPTADTVKRPLLVTIIAILTFIGGVFFLLAAVPALIFGVIVSLITGVNGIVAIASGIGLMKMKKWGYYLFQFFTILSIIQALYLRFSGAESTAADWLLSVALPVVIFIYLWAERKKFR